MGLNSAFKVFLGKVNAIIFPEAIYKSNPEATAKTCGELFVILTRFLAMCITPISPMVRVEVLEVLALLRSCS